MRAKKLFGILTTCAILAAFMLAPAISMAATTLKLGHTGAPDHHYQVASEMFAKNVKDRTNGEIIIEVYPSDLYGKQKQLVSQAQQGLADMVLTSDAVISSFVPIFGVLNLPFLFQDINHVANTMDGEVGEMLAQEAGKKGLEVLGYWENGFRHITNNKNPINTPADMKGIKLRTPESKLVMDSFKALGASPVPMSFGEIYSALQTGTVDGQENPIAHLLAQKWYEVQKYLSLTGHQHYVEPLLMSQEKFQQLTPEQQKILKEEAQKIAIEIRKLATQDEQKMLDEVKKHMQVNEVPDKKPFMEAVEPVYEQVRVQFGPEILEKIQAAGAK